LEAAAPYEREEEISLMEVPICRPFYRGDEGGPLAEVIASGWVSQGPRVAEFERAFADRVGAAEAVATTSCTTAMTLALYASGVRPGDEVIVPSFSYIATANCIWHMGAVPVFVDIDPDTFNIDPVAAERAITPRTKAIMPVHQLGLPADMDAFVDIAKRHGLVLVEDAACAVGATYRSRPIGSIETSLACFSLDARKVITTGEGGMITLQDSDVAAYLRRLRHHAVSVSDLQRHGSNDVVIESYPERGWNLRMTDMQGALGLCQLEMLDEIRDARRVRAERYTEALAGIASLEPPVEPDYAERTWQSYAMRLTPAAEISRNELMGRLLADGISTRRGVMAIHEEPAYAQAGLSLPHTEAATRETLMLPLFPGLTFEQQDYVIDRVSAHLLALAAA
jgi:dTDP-4-amino-4,6-dideoxygalactose transaminase